MVHVFSHIHKDKRYYFMWDVESGSLGVLDYVAFLCIKMRLALPLSREEEHDFLTLPQDKKMEAMQEIDMLAEKGIFSAPPLVTEFRKSTDTVKALCLHICHDCNLTCDYCFADGGSYKTEREYMSFEVGKAAVDFLIRHSGKRKNLEIDFFGGEPLMNLTVVKKIVDYAKAEGANAGKIFSFTMTTNCLLLSEENIAYLDQEMDNVVLSIDGRECVHNGVRHSKNGRDVFPRILENAKRFRERRGEGKYYVRGTFTAKNLDFSEDVRALREQGFDQISMEPVVLPELHPLSIREEHMERIAAEYEKLTEYYIDCRNSSKKWFNFFHYMIDLDHGPCQNKRLTGCGAGTEYLAVAPKGGLYPCHQFVGIEEYKIGNVFDGIENQGLRERFASISVLQKPHCEHCFAKYYCGGGCTANALNFSSDLNGQYQIGCELTKKRMEMSLTVAALEKMQPQSKSE